MIKWIIGLTFLLGVSFQGELCSQDIAKADSALNVLNNEKNLSFLDSLKLLRKIYYHHANSDSVIKYSELSMGLLRGNEEEYLFWMHNAYLNKGYALKLKGNVEEALEAHIKSLEYANKLKISRYLGAAYNAIAADYRVQGNYASSVKYYYDGLRAFQEDENSSLVQMASMYVNIGECYRLSNHLDSALILFNKSKVFFDSTNYELGIAYSEGNIGLVYEEQGKYEVAEEYLKSANRTLEKLGDIYPVAVYTVSLGKIYKARGDTDKALEYMLDSYNMSMHEGLKEQVRDASQHIYKLYAELGDYQKAFDYQTKYYAYKDSVVDQETIRKMADMRTEYEVNQKQSEVDLLVSEKTRQTVVAVSLGVVTVLVMIVAFLLYRNNQQRKQANELLEEQKEEIETQRDQLDELNRTKDRFFSIISHDLRGPVQAFKGMGRLIKVLVEEENIAELKELNVDFDNSVSQLSRVLDDLLDWAMAQQGSIPFHPEKVELPSVVNNLKDLFHNMARAKNISLATDVESDLAVYADMNSLNTILRNLLNNALKFTPEGGHIQLSAIRKKGMVAISVKDTGIGIEKDKLDSLFKLGGSKRSWGTQGEKGLGLGLQLVYQFTALNGGEVTVESEENEGSVFTVYLPDNEV
ncbi:tetratricopeptide repeat-containing sensor histidine kinase [Fulvivirga maritima]|uniref:tetratricopeptide repeat-containing sensor histidine kinase n=1 Tax=Fulvivirga maritima TaxID=2904247 RepID=UPI001F229B84|nr:tetratricopeptide repeat-containing sensor histidine kinase [Fulvivirga maritima]UII24523.1 tetratricopeptide repeat-containing sensor histidine kinase [Fulvivirga maritima]